MESQDSIYLFSELLEGGIKLSDSVDLAPGTAILVHKRLLAFSDHQRPDRIAIRASAVSKDGRSHTAEIEIAIVRYEAKNEFRFPVEGRWYLAASSSVRSHHRIRPAHEFAIDLIKISGDGSSHRGDGTKPEDYYAFGENVVVVADGTVVRAVDDVPDTEMPRKGESRREFAVRVLDAMWQKDPTGRIAEGNLVVVEHAGDEHSVYAHLKQGSVRVKAGDAVKQGQLLGQVGISGDGFQPHLHFQVNDGPNPQLSRGLPVIFTNVAPVPFSSTIDMKEDRLYMAGEFVETTD
jgi:murein DD-endopeptidase MepM/ murein hydrolase activator NlpD